MPRQPGERYHLRPALAEELWQYVTNADQIVLYSLLPDFQPGKAPAAHFHGYSILGSIEIGEPARKASISAALRAGAEAGTLGYRCWDPHHGVRVEQGRRILDFVICFTCECMQVFVDPNSDSFEWADITAEPETVLDALMTEAGIPLAPRRRI